MGETGQKNFWNKISLIRFASHTVYYLREYLAKTHITTGLLYACHVLKKFGLNSLQLVFLIVISGGI